MLNFIQVFMEFDTNYVFGLKHISDFSLVRHATTYELRCVDWITASLAEQDSLLL